MLLALPGRLSFQVPIICVFNLVLKRFLPRLILMVDSHEILSDIILHWMQELFLEAFKPAALDLGLKVEAALTQRAVLL